MLGAIERPIDHEVPTSTNVGICSQLSAVATERLSMATLIMRGEFDEIAGMDDYLVYPARPSQFHKEFSAVQGISHALFQQKNLALDDHILRFFIERPEPVHVA